MAQMLPDPVPASKKVRLFMKLTFLICVAGTVVSSIVLGQENLALAVVAALGFWFAYALLAIRTTRLQGNDAHKMVATDKEFPEAADRETGLATAVQFSDQLKREIARSLRYGDRAALAVFDIRVIGPAAANDTAQTSPAGFIAGTMQKSVRETDFVARLDMTHFAVLMTESDEVGGQALISRVRTWLALEPFARDASGKGLYVRAWAGCVAWKPEYHDANLFLRAAVDEMERSRPNDEAMQSAFAGIKGQASTAGSQIFSRGA